ncbi:MAG: nuclear transport factor 2 family protein [Armatimonadetes bacterium]|nr:nuclear transport factor 2 family protein [Armatimonadota bacterium]
MTIPRILIPASALCVAVLTLPCLAAAPADTKPPAPADSARAGILEAYDQINMDFLRRDIPQVMSYFAPDYTETNERGAKADKEQTYRRYQDEQRQITSMRTRYTLQNLTPTAAGILVEMRMHSDGTGVKRILFATLHGTFTNDLWVRDLWVDTPQGWRLKHRQTLQDQTHTHPG